MHSRIYKKSYIAYRAQCFIPSWNVQAAWCLNKTHPKNICRDNIDTFNTEMFVENFVPSSSNASKYFIPNCLL